MTVIAFTLFLLAAQELREWIEVRAQRVVRVLACLLAPSLSDQVFNGITENGIFIRAL